MEQDTVPRRLATLKRLFPVGRFRGWFLACGGVLLIGLAAWAVGTAYIYLQPGGYPVREHGPDGAGLVIGLGFVMVWFLSGALFAGVLCVFCATRLVQALRRMQGRGQRAGW